MAPELVYVDASHHYEDVLQDLRMCLAHFPGAQVRCRLAPSARAMPALQLGLTTARTQASSSKEGAAISKLVAVGAASESEPCDATGPHWRMVLDPSASAHSARRREQICGDDWDYPPVARAVREVADERGLQVAGRLAPRPGL